MRLCSIDGCKEKHRAKGFCKIHYGKAIRGNEIQINGCKVKGCAGNHEAKGYCNPHYCKWRRWGDPLFAQPEKPETCSIEGCERERRSLGFCDMHHKRVWRHGDPHFEQFKPKDMFEKFLKYVKPEKEGCWPWKGSKTRQGYGIFKYNYKDYSAHRTSYLYFKGPIDAGLFIMHSCDNPICINPEHLSAGTAKDNMIDRDNKGRQAKGSKNGGAKLVESQVLEIRKKLKKKSNIDVLAQEYGVSISAIHAIKTGKLWRSI